MMTHLEPYKPRGLMTLLMVIMAALMVVGAASIVQAHKLGQTQAEKLDSLKTTQDVNYANTQAYRAHLEQEFACLGKAIADTQTIIVSGARPTYPLPNPCP